MNKRYHHKFIGADDVTNQFEIWTNKNAQSILVEASAQPFVVEYAEVKKLEPVRGSQATMELVSQSIFQFVDLHTDTMQDYLVKFYRDEKLYWLGWLDSELYNEQLSATPPYYATFTASDFNIWERLKYRDAAENPYTDIASLMTHLKRCFDALQLPFNKLYISCTTIPEGIAMAREETPLHVLYMMSANFYDEDAEPMTLREVVENILRPFGLMMVQKDANVYIYDYNTVKRGLPMKRYDFASWSYEADESYDFNHGNLPDIGFMSTDSSYGFEEMVNNVQITSSLYADVKMTEVSISEKTLSEENGKVENRRYSLYYYNKCEGIENLSGKFARYEREGESDIDGCYLPYKTNPASLDPVFRVKVPTYLIGSDGPANINVKMQAYVNTRDNPFNNEEGIKEDKNSGALKLYCNLYTTDASETPIKYCDLDREASGGRDEAEINPDRIRNYWEEATAGTIQPGKFILWFSNEDTANSILDTWVTNANKSNPTTALGIISTVPSTLVSKGLNIPTKGNSGFVVFEITGKARVVNPQSDSTSTPVTPLAEDKVKHLLLNDISISILDKDGKELSTDDYEFKSYVNKKVATDLADITLKCISANEEKAPIGKANMLKKIDNRYELQLSFTRSGQTDILERLLMCTIHSNFATKKELFTVDIKMRENPALCFVSYEPILSDKYLVAGCKLDFQRAVSTITAVGYSDDAATLSSIPYD